MQIQNILHQILDRLGILQEDVTSLKSDVTSLKTDVSELKADVGLLKSKVDTLDKGQSALQDGQFALQESVDFIVENCASKQDLSDAEHRMTKHLDGFATRQQKFDIELAAHQTQLDRLKAQAA